MERKTLAVKMELDKWKWLADNNGYDEQTYFQAQDEEDGVDKSGYALRMEPRPRNYNYLCNYVGATFGSPLDKTLRCEHCPLTAVAWVHNCQELPSIYADWVESDYDYIHAMRMVDKLEAIMLKLKGGLKC